MTVLTMVSSCDSLIAPRNVNLGNGYLLEKNKGNYSAQVLNSSNTVMINAVVLGYCYDSTFIIVVQRPWKIIPEGLNYKESKEYFEKSTFLQYWIINKLQENKYSYNSLNHKATYSNVYGPFNKNEYIDKRATLGVPQSLQLNE